MTLQRLKSELDRIRDQKTIVFTNGCFDILHVGHIRYLEQAKALGDLLVVAVNSDASVVRLKGPSRPVQTESDRVAILQALKSVDYVFVFDGETPEAEIQALRPHVLVKGGDWPADQIVGASFVQSYGGLVRSLSFVQGRSTSSIIDKILKI